VYNIEPQRPAEYSVSQEKTELDYFDNLPDELILNIGNRITGIENRNAFVLTCQRFYQRYQPERLFLTLLKNITESNLDKVRLILEKYPGLLSRYGAITDPTGCIFKRITAFQYALWAMDLKDMCRIILNSIPKDKTGDELRFSLFNQLRELEENGISYKKAGVKYNEKHFNLSPLKNALTIYISSYPNWSFDEVKTYWCKIIGGEQKHFPINIRHFYCGHREVILGQIIIKRSLTLHDYTNNTEIKWDKDLDGLGIRSAIRHSRKRGAWASADRNTAQGDLDALDRFEKNYQEELILIKDELQEAIRAHTHEEKSLANG
jgi:hypothetical protein